MMAVAMMEPTAYGKQRARYRLQSEESSLMAELLVRKLQKMNHHHERGLMNALFYLLPMLECLVRSLMCLLQLYFLLFQRLAQAENSMDFRTGDSMMKRFHHVI